MFLKEGRRNEITKTMKGDEMKIQNKLFPAEFQH
jgi:hypothetical protein